MTPRDIPFPCEVVKMFRAFGLTCSVCRGPNSLNGYVCLPLDHPDAKEDLHYDAIDVSVHGGLTFGEMLPLGAKLVGFDTHHAGDWIAAPPGFPQFERPGRIWTVDDVEQETRQLARQLAARRSRAAGGDKS